MENKENITSRRILIVEDDPRYGRSLRKRINDGGIDAKVVHGVSSASDALKTGGFSEIITDGLDGDWAKIVSVANHTPVKLLTGDPTQFEKASKMGIPFFSKRCLELEDLLNPDFKNSDDDLSVSAFLRY